MNSKILLCLFLAVAAQSVSAGIATNLRDGLRSLSSALTRPPPPPPPPPAKKSVTCPSVPAGQCRNFTSDQIVDMDLLGYLRTYTPRQWYVPYASRSVYTSYANSLDGTRDRSNTELDQVCLRDAFLTVLCVSSGYGQNSPAINQICVPQPTMKLAQMCCQQADGNLVESTGAVSALKSYPASRITILKTNQDQSELLVVRCVNGQDDFKVLSKRPTVSSEFETTVNQTLRSLNFNLDDSNVGRQSYSNCGRSASTTTSTAAPSTTEETTTTAAPSTTEETTTTAAPSTTEETTAATEETTAATEETTAATEETTAATEETTTEATSTETTSSTSESSTDDNLTATA